MLDIPNKKACAPSENSDLPGPEPSGRQLAIEISVSNAFRSTFVDSTSVFDCRLPGVIIVINKRFA